MRLLIGILLFPILCNSQSLDPIQAKIVDSKTNEPIPFATVRLYVQGELTGGLVSNQNGDFQLPSKSKITLDSILISCIGYSNLRLLSNNFAENQINILKLIEGAVGLKEVVVTGGKKLTAAKIVRLAVRNITANYPQFPYTYIAYYRDYQLEQNQYVNLNEAIVEVFDKGFNANDVQTTREKLYEYRENTTFERDSLTVAPYDFNKNKFIPGVRLFPFGGNELSILRIHDALRNYQSTTYSFVNVFQKDFLGNHSFKLLGTVYLNHVPLYRINVQSINTVSGKNYTARGEIYIEHGNYAIHKISYGAYDRKSSEEKLLYSIDLEYARSDSRMYLNYISCNNFFLSKSNDGFAVTQITLDKELNAFIVRFNHSPETKSALRASNYSFLFDNRTIDFDKIELNAKDDKEVFLRISPRQASAISDPARVKVSFKDIKDKTGREINEIAYKEVNQFRELFMQKLNPTQNQSDIGMFISPELPLKQNKTDSTKSSSNYWMNTPLKK